MPKHIFRKVWYALYDLSNSPKTVATPTGPYNARITENSASTRKIYQAAKYMDKRGKHFNSQVLAVWLYRSFAPQIQISGIMALVVLLVVLTAFLWILWRAAIVWMTPDDVLVEKLGLDIPPGPELTLESICSRTVDVSWQLPEDATSSVSEWLIYVDRKPVGNPLSKQEMAAQLNGLKPNRYYDIRVYSISSSGFQTPSTTLHVRTARDRNVDSEHHAQITVQPIAARILSSTSVVNAVASSRDTGTGLVPVRRGTIARKGSPAGQPEQTETNASDDEPIEDLSELSQQFQNLQHERDNINAQMLEDEREFEAMQQERETKLEAVKQDWKERDEQSAELRKQVRQAEATNRQLQNERQKKERALKERESKRKRRIDEVNKWEERSQSISEEIEGINKQKEAIKKRAASEVAELKEKIEEERKTIAEIEEQNKDIVSQIKELQEERRRNDLDEDTEETQEAQRTDRERDEQFRRTITSLSRAYNDAWAELHRAQQESVLHRQRLAMYDTARRATAVSFTPMNTSALEPLHRIDRTIRAPQHASSHGSNVSSPQMAHAPEPFMSVNQAVTTSSPHSSQHTNVPNVFNPVNGMVIAIDDPAAVEDEDETYLAAPMSPRADALLPQGLLGDESADEAISPEDRAPRPTQVQEEPSTFPFPTYRPASLRGMDSYPQEEPSPSASSPRSFASPREEFFPQEELERRSMHSMHPPIPEDAPAEPIHKKLAGMSNLFSFSRQRGKTSADLPSFGSLKSESHSFPRQPEEFDLAQPRRRLSYGGGAWAFPGGNFMAKPEEHKEEPYKPSLARRAFGLSRSTAARNYDPFAPRTSSLDPRTQGGSSSPRPGSVYSFERLPRPSAEESFRNWSLDRPGNRASPLVPDWASSLSRSHSRRPSIGYGGSTSNLSMSMAVDGGDYIEPPRREKSLQAPIGTRPQSSSQARPVTPKLNPAAPAFTMFGFGKKDKEKDKDKTKEERREKSSASTTVSGSPPESRKSRDTHSVTNTISTSADDREDLERTNSGISSLQGGGPHTSVSLESTPASVRPTFMSKITRKASSSKFEGWKRTSTLFSSKAKALANGEATTPTGEKGDDEHEHLMSSTEHLGRSLESNSTISTPTAEDRDLTPDAKGKNRDKRSSLGSSWSFMMRKKTRDSKGTPSKERDVADMSVSEVSESDHGDHHDDMSLEGMRYEDMEEGEKPST